METLIIETQEQAEALVVNNLLKFEGHLIFKCRINAGWSIKAGGYIKAGWSIKAGEYINAGLSIEAGGYIKAGEYINAGLSIEAGEFIEAGEYINAGEFIKAGGYIKAGADWGIYCGISLRISNKSQATITAKSEPANILLGLFVK